MWAGACTLTQARQPERTRLGRRSGPTRPAAGRWACARHTPRHAHPRLGPPTTPGSTHTRRSCCTCGRLCRRERFLRQRRHGRFGLALLHWHPPVDGRGAGCRPSGSLLRTRFGATTGCAASDPSHSESSHSSRCRSVARHRYSRRQGIGPGIRARPCWRARSCQQQQGRRRG